MSLVQEAVSIAFSAQKMNVELLGNGDAHAHWHIFPRREGDMKGHGLNGRGPVWWVPWEEMVAEEYHVKNRRLENLIATLSENFKPDSKMKGLKMKKRYLVLSGLLALTLAACSQEKPANSETTAAIEEKTIQEGTVGVNLRKPVRKRRSSQ